MQTHQEQFAYCRADAKGDVLDIAYDEVVANGFDEIRAFLKMEPKEMIPQRQKLRSSDTLSRYEPECHDEIREVLEEIGKPERAFE